MQIGRRSFLQITAGAAVLSGMGLPKKAFAGTDKQLSTLIDLSLCDGCVDQAKDRLHAEPGQGICLGAGRVNAENESGISTGSVKRLRTISFLKSSIQ